jgi:hypothetical protein
MNNLKKEDHLIIAVLDIFTFLKVLLKKNSNDFLNRPLPTLFSKYKLLEPFFIVPAFFIYMPPKFLYLFMKASYATIARKQSDYELEEIFVAVENLKKLNINEFNVFVRNISQENYSVFSEEGKLLSTLTKIILFNQ